MKFLLELNDEQERDDLAEIVKHYITWTAWAQTMPLDQKEYGTLDLDELRRRRALAERLTS